MTHRIEHSRGAADERGAAPGTGARPAGYEGYDAALEAAAVHPRGPRGILLLTGADAVQFLHGILTNDINGLEPGRACYAAYLTPQGRMIADMDVLRRSGDLLLDVEPALHDTLARRLDGSIFTEDVSIEDVSDRVASLGVYGPAAGPRLRQAIEAAGGTVDPPTADRHVTVAAEGGALTVLGTRRAGVGGFHVFGPGPAVEKLGDLLAGVGLPLLGDLAAESLRIEAGVPRFGVDMTEDTIPLEAGIESRAISMTKGCYVGQEVIVRILHRGHGRVVRRLVKLRSGGETAPPAGAKLVSGERDVGHVTSAVRSPRFGIVALGYVQRDFVQPGTRLEIAGSGEAAEVRD